MTGESQIPKIIHYCWFGKEPLPEAAVRCIESWHRFLPGYEIKRWDETNYDVNACPYTKQAYAAGKWAFVSDYARFDILYAHGGVYFDTDVELIRPIDDILRAGAFFGAEQNGPHFFVNPGLGMAAAPEHPVYREILSEYEKRHFLNADGSFDQTTVVKYTTAVLRWFGLTDTTDISCIEGIWIYPWDYFCPMECHTGKLTVTENTRSVHHFAGSWFSKEEKAAQQVERVAAKLLGEKLGRKLGRAYSFPYRVRKKIEAKGFWGAAAFAVGKICNNGREKQ